MAAVQALVAIGPDQERRLASVNPSEFSAFREPGKESKKAVWKGRALFPMKSQSAPVTVSRLSEWFDPARQRLGRTTCTPLSG